jgi:hypothetical protein
MPALASILAKSSLFPMPQVFFGSKLTTAVATSSEKDNPLGKHF